MGLISDAERYDFSKGMVSRVEVESIAQRVDLKKLHRESICVTGSGGLIGNYLSQAIAKVMALQGYSLGALVLQAREVKPEKFDWTKEHANIQILREALDFTEVLPDCENVIHAASPASPSEYGAPVDIWVPNISGIISAISMAPTPKRILFISSGEVYDYTSQDDHPVSQPATFRKSATRSSYPNAKLATERLLLASKECASSNFAIARLFHTFGPGFKPGDGRSFADFFTSASVGEPIRLYSAGAGQRNFAYIEDSVSGLLAILLKESEEDIFDVGGEERYSIRNFAELVAHQSGVPLVLDDKDAQGQRSEIFGNPPQPNLRPLLDLGWQQQVSVQEGVARTLDAMRKVS